MKEILFASTNRGKLIEVKEFSAARGIKIIGPNDLGYLGKAASDLPNVTEDRDTYEGNAAIKADAFFKWSGIPSLADDTGLEVDALHGQPGIFSARYAGEPSNPKKNMEKLLFELKDCGKRRARFVCVLAFRTSDTDLVFERGELEGEIAREPLGAGGFGYDSVFFIPRFGKTLAELKEAGGPVETHRTIALGKLFG
jgi:XTP/dITP diphosphohydrolase